MLNFKNLIKNKIITEKIIQQNLSKSLTPKVNAWDKIMKIANDDKLRKTIAKNGKEKYMKYFNSNLVAEFIINKCFDINNKNYYLWHNR